MTRPGEGHRAGPLRALGIGVGMPDTKTWWRNFLGEGGPISLHLDGVAHTGHGVARRDGSGAAAVTVHFDGGPPVD